MLIADILNKDNILLLDGDLSKRQVLQLLAQKVAETVGIDERTLFDALWERENLGSTAFGKGIAFPHARVAGIKSLRTVFAKVKNGVDFDANDEKNVDLFFMLVSPEDNGADHLTALSLMAEAMKDVKKLALLRATNDSEKIFDILVK